MSTSLLSWLPRRGRFGAPTIEAAVVLLEGGAKPVWLAVVWRGLVTGI